MISAFGVEHVSKSMVGGGHYIPASKLTSGAKNIIRNRMKPENKNTHVPGKKVKGQTAKGRQIYEDDVPTRSLGRKVTTDVLPDSPHPKLKPMGHTLLGASRPNGRGGGIVRMNPNAPDQANTYRHEMAHISPKRNPVRFFERTSGEGRRLGREEGRADFTASGKRTPGQYPGNRDFQRGYDEVQTKMHRAKKQPRKRRTFAVNSSGEAVQKSAFGVMHR